MYTAMYDENSDKDPTYLGSSEMRRQDEFKAEKKVPITEHCYIHSKLLDITYCKILLNPGASK